jgi:hypothetical protein
LEDLGLFKRFLKVSDFNFYFTTYFKEKYDSKYDTQKMIDDNPELKRLLEEF